MSGKRRRFDGFLKPRIGFVQPSDAALEMHKSIARAAKPFSELAEKLRPLTEAMRPMAEFSARLTDAINPVVGDEEAPEIKNNISERPKRNIATPTASPIAAAHLQRFLLDRADGETTEPNLKKAAQDAFPTNTISRQVWRKAFADLPGKKKRKRGQTGRAIHRHPSG
ncbi:MAG: hypothetical protein H0T75_04280 [Rhizobiales bacterium]|nr:hypothetical protein [Hyphomicrobiales bacterium]